MTLNQLLSRFPGIQPLDPTFIGRPTEKSSGLIRFTLRPGNYRCYGVVQNMSTMSLVNTGYFQGLEGIDHINLTFIDRNLTNLEIGYDDKIKWNSVEEFKTQTAEALNLSDRWKGGNSLTCDGFIIRADRTYPAMSIQLTDVAAEHAYNKREDEKRRREEDQRKNTFKP